MNSADIMEGLAHPKHRYFHSEATAEIQTYLTFVLQDSDIADGSLGCCEI